MGPVPSNRVRSGWILDGGKQGNKNKLLAPWKEGTSREGNKKGAAASEDEDEDEEGQQDEDDDEGDNPTWYGIAV